MTQTGRSSDSDRVEVDRLAPREEDQGDSTGEGQSAAESRSDDQGWFAAMGANRLILVSLLGAVVTIGLLLAVTGGGLILLVVAVLALLVVIGLVTAFVLKLTTEEKPSVETVARLEAEGVHDPESALNERIDALPEDDQDGVDPESELDEPAREQKGKVTPSSESRPVGPDDD